MLRSYHSQQIPVPTRSLAPRVRQTTATPRENRIPQPATGTLQLAAENHILQPNTGIPQPVTGIPQPAAVNHIPQPATGIPQPAAENHIPQPATGIPQPVTGIPQPGAENNILEPVKENQISLLPFRTQEIPVLQGSQSNHRVEEQQQQQLRNQQYRPSPQQPPRPKQQTPLREHTLAKYIPKVINYSIIKGNLDVFSIDVQ